MVGAKLMNDKAGNLEQVRAALQGITGVELRPENRGPDRYLVMVRMNRELDAVDSFRRHSVPAYWPSYQELAPTQRVRGGHPVRRMRRVGIMPGYVFAAADHSFDMTLLLDRIVGAFDVVRTMSGNPLMIGDADIQIIRKIEIGLNAPSSEKVIHDLKKGEKVRFVDDLIGRWPPGRISKLAKDGRIGVEVELMGRKVEITVLPFQIERM